MLALKKKLAGRLQSVLGLGVNVKLVEPRSIERSVGKMCIRDRKRKEYSHIYFFSFLYGHYVSVDNRMSSP